VSVKRINIDIDRELWARMSGQAIREGVQKRELVEKAFAQYLRMPSVAKSIENNRATCQRILEARIAESDAIYMPELNPSVLNDREIYIYHRAFGEGVEAAYNTLTALEENLLDGLFQS